MTFFFLIAISRSFFCFHRRATTKNYLEQRLRVMAAIIITTAPRKPQPQESHDHGMAWKQQKPSLSRKSVWPKKQRLIKMESSRDSQKITRFGKNELLHQLSILILLTRNKTWHDREQTANMYPF